MTLQFGQVARLTPNRIMGFWGWGGVVRENKTTSKQCLINFDVAGTCPNVIHPSTPCSMAIFPAWLLQAWGRGDLHWEHLKILRTSRWAECESWGEWLAPVGLYSGRGPPQSVTEFNGNFCIIFSDLQTQIGAQGGWTGMDSNIG